MVKVVTHKLYFSGVTAFSTLSADLRSRLKPPSDYYHFLKFPMGTDLPKMSGSCASRSSRGPRLNYSNVIMDMGTKEIFRNFK